MEDTCVTRTPAVDRPAIAARRFASRSPTLEPSDRYTLLNITSHQIVAQRFAVHAASPENSGRIENSRRKERRLTARRPFFNFADETKVSRPRLACLAWPALALFPPSAGTQTHDRWCGRDRTKQLPRRARGFLDP